MTEPSPTRAGRRTPLDLVRGALIGLAEVVPGVSGGTIALVTGLYDTLILGAGHLVSALRLLVADLARGRGTGRSAAELRRARWQVLVPVGAGMVTALVIGARVLEPVLEEHPEGARAVFFGLICASLVVPVRLIRADAGRWPSAREWWPAVTAAATAFVLTGLPPAQAADPPLLLVGLAAAVAVCALVLPGVSGSFLLLTVGLYETTLAAVNGRDLAYLGVFVAGAALGLGSFVKMLQWLLEHRHRATLLVMTGLMAGSLRALWPWQEEDRTLLAPGGNTGSVVLLALAGAGVVLAVLLVESRVTSQHADQPGDLRPDPLREQGR